MKLLDKLIGKKIYLYACSERGNMEYDDVGVYFYSKGVKRPFWACPAKWHITGFKRKNLNNGYDKITIRIKRV